MWMSDRTLIGVIQFVTVGSADPGSPEASSLQEHRPL